MSRITREAVEDVAHLARLALDEAQLAQAAGELEAMLDYVAVLDAVDTEGVPPTSHVLQLATPLRDDARTEVLPAELAVANAPERDGTAFVVPKVIEEEEAG